MTTNEHPQTGLAGRPGAVRLSSPGPLRPPEGPVRADRHGSLDGSVPILWRSLRRRWYLLLLAGIVGAGIGYGVSNTRPLVYEATSTLLLNDRALGDGGALRPDAAESLVELHAERVGAPDTLRLAAAELGMDEQALTQAVTTRPEPSAWAVTVAASAQDGGQAAAIADAVAFAYEDKASRLERSAQELSEAALQERIEVLEERIAEETDVLETLPDDLVTSQRLGGLVSQQLELELRLDDLGNARVDEVVSSVFPATVPTAPTSPVPVRDAALAALAAALVVAAGLWFQATRASEVRSSIGDVVDAPLLAELPADRRITGLWNGRDDGAGVSDAIYLVDQAIDRYHGDGGLVLLFAGVDRERDRRRVAEQTAALMGARSDRDVTVVRFARRHRDGRWPILPTRSSGAWLAVRQPPGSDHTHAVEPVRELALARAAGSVVVVVGPDASSPEATNLALASDSVVLVVSSRDSASDLLRLRRLLDVVGVPVMGYVYTKRAG
jgi:uncharacterized coiled-coil protein SlyX